MAAVGCVIAFVVSFTALFFLGIKEKNTSKTLAEKNKEIKDEKVYVPVKGTAVALKDVNDPTFAQEVIGKGIAI